MALNSSMWLPKNELTSSS